MKILAIPVTLLFLIVLLPLSAQALTARDDGDKDQIQAISDNDRLFFEQRYAF